MQAFSLRKNRQKKKNASISEVPPYFVLFGGPKDTSNKNFLKPTIALKKGDRNKNNFSYNLNIVIYIHANVVIALEFICIISITSAETL